MNLIESSAGLTVFEGLKSYSRTDVELVNRFGDLFDAGPAWRVWIQEGLGALLEVAGERRILLEQTNQIEPGDNHKASFQKDEVRIGRESSNDVVVPLVGVGRHHARIKRQGTRYFIQDLGSANGTYLNGVKLHPHESVTLNEDAQFLIFPYQFTFSSRQEWSRQEPVRIASGVTRVASWGARQSGEFGGTQLFSVKVSPGLGTAVLGVSKDLVKALVNRISHAEISDLVSADAGLLEFLLLSVLERANRELHFPFRFSLSPFEGLSKDARGISLECSLGLTGAAGAIELFLPASLLKEIRLFPRHDRPIEIPVHWPLTVTTGYSDLSLQEFAELQAGDILLITPAHRLLLPSGASGSGRGWRAALTESDPRRLRIEDYFEGSDLTMDSQAESPEQSDSQKPNLGTLPVRIHVVLSQLEMTLAELNRLRPGNIIELDRGKSENVQLAINGKIAGAGELVEIEGRLGVRVLSWTAQ